MPISAGVAFVDIVPSFQGFGQKLSAGVTQQVQGASRNISKSFDQVTGKVTSGVKTSAAGFTNLARSAAGAFGGFQIGRTLTNVFNEVDTGLDTIRTQTGATGSALKGLEDSFKRVGGAVPDNLTHVGEVMADLASRTGLTGKPLEILTTRMLELQRTGPGAGATAATITRLFGDWSIATGDQTTALDKLFRASQATGVPVEQLGQSITKFGGPLRQLGFSLDQSAVLLGKFEKEGVNTELVAGSLRIALGKMAKAGVKDVPKALEASIKKIKEAGTAGEANALALELFGARAGPDMAAAIREGRFDIAELFNTVASGKDTVQKAADDALDFGDKLKILGNKAKIIIAPLGEFGQVIGGLGAGLGALSGTGGFGKVAKGLGGLGKSFATFGKALLTNPIFLIAAAVIGLGLVIFKFRKQIGDALKAVGGFFADFGKGVINFFKDLPKRILGFVKDFFPLIIGVLFPVGGIVAALIKFRKPILDFFGNLLGWVLKALGNVGRFLFDAGKDLLQGLWDGVKALVGAYIGFWKALPGLILRGLGNVGRFLFDAGKKIMQGFWNGVKAIVGAYIGFWRELPGRILRALGNIGQFLFNAGKKLLKGMLNGIASITQAFFGFWKDLPGRIIRAIGNLGSILFDAGKKIMQGLWDGLKSLVGDILDWFGDLGGKFRRNKGPEAKDKKLLRDPGRWIMQGLIAGLQDEEGHLVSELRRLTGVVGGAGGVISTRPSGVTALTPGGEASLVGSTFNFNIRSTDPRAAAREVEQVIDRKLRDVGSKVSARKRIRSDA